MTVNWEHTDFRDFNGFQRFQRTRLKRFFSKHDSSSNIKKESFKESSPCRSARKSSDPEPKNPDFVSWSMM